MSPFFQDNCHGKYPKGNGDSFHSMHITVKLKDSNKIERFDSEISKVLVHWNEMLGREVIKLCHEMNFTTGFCEGGDSQDVIDSYELKVRLEHLLERMSLVSQSLMFYASVLMISASQKHNIQTFLSIKILRYLMLMMQILAIFLTMHMIS